MTTTKDSVERPVCVPLRSDSRQTTATVGQCLGVGSRGKHRGDGTAAAGPQGAAPVRQCYFEYPDGLTPAHFLMSSKLANRHSFISAMTALRRSLRNSSSVWRTPIADAAADQDRVADEDPVRRRIPRRSAEGSRVRPARHRPRPERNGGDGLIQVSGIPPDVAPVFGDNGRPGSWLDCVVTSPLSIHRGVSGRGVPPRDMPEGSGSISMLGKGDHFLAGLRVIDPCQP